MCTLKHVKHAPSCYLLWEARSVNSASLGTLQCRRLQVLNHVAPLTAWGVACRWLRNSNPAWRHLLQCHMPTEVCCCLQSDLVDAAMNGDVDRVRYCLDAGVSVNCKVKSRWVGALLQPVCSHHFVGAACTHQVSAWCGWATGLALVWPVATCDGWLGMGGHWR
jgi:hypothetical protein